MGVGITQQRNLNFINLKDYGCVIDGVTDDSIPFTAAYTAASAQKMALYHPGGTLIKGNDTLLSNVPILGAGPGVSTIKLKNGANTDLFSAQTSSINLSAAVNVGILGTLSRFSIRGLTLDGNKANQSSGTSYPLRFYGYDFLLSDLEIVNGYTGGYLSDWNFGSSVGAGSDQMESRIENIKIHDNNGIGFQFGGPHDSRISNVICFSNGSHSFHFCPNANGVLVEDGHGYLLPNTTGLCHWLIEIASGSNFVNCISDGGHIGTIGVAILGASVTWQGELYTSNGNAGVQIGQAAGQTPIPSQILQAAGVTTALQASGTFLNASINGCTGGGINFANEVNSYVLANIFQGSGSAVVGTPDPSDTFIIKATGLTADGTLAKSGGTQLVSSSTVGLKVFANSGAALLRLDGTNKILVPASLGLTPAAATVPATGGTITTSGIGVARVNPASLVTGIILQAGTTDGQIAVVENKSAFYLIMAASGTSNVASGTNDYIPANTGAIYEWNNGQSLWYRINPPLAVPTYVIGRPNGGIGAGTNGIANTVYLFEEEIYAPVTITSMRVRFATGGNGHYDLGIYDASGANGAPGVLLANCAALSSSLVTVNASLQSPALISNVTLIPGKYWLAVWIDNATDTMINIATQGIAGLFPAKSGGNAGPLPANASSISSIANATLRFIVEALPSGGWS